MKKIIASLVIIFFLFSIIFVACTMGSQSDLSDPPVVIASLEGHMLSFHCFTPNTCPQNVNLDNFIEQSEESFYFDRILYTNSNKIYAILYDGAKNGLIVYINPKEKKARLIKLPITIDHSLSITEGEKLIVGNKHGKIVIIQDDQVIQNINLGIEAFSQIIGKLISGPRTDIVAINENYLKEQDKIFAEIFLINVNSGEFETNRFDITNVADIKDNDATKSDILYITNITSDLKRIYYFFTLIRSEESPVISLGSFDIQHHRIVTSTGDISCINWMMGYSQYKDVLYVSKLNSETDQPATLLRMDTLKPIDSILNSVKRKDGQTSKLLISPFRDNLLLGTDNRITVFTLDGKEKSEYLIPQDWANRNYLILERLQP